MDSLKGVTHVSNLCCFRKTTGSSEGNRRGQLKTGGRMNSETSEKNSGKKEGRSRQCKEWK